ncbi:MAG: hypothetical protein JXB50_12755 [Spirochaetes bacterium]|nr:hypothetical protein [Spirochaetota bacterium]
MRFIKIILLTFIIIFFINILVYSNEKNFTDKSTVSFSFRILSKGFMQLIYNEDDTENLKSKITNFRLTNSQMSQLFKIIFIMGVVVGSIGLLMVIPGSIMMGIAVGVYQAPYNWIGLQNDPGYNLWFGGISLLASGSALFVLALSMIIVGLVMNWYYGGRIVFNTETDIKNRALKTSLSYKF